MRESVSVLEKMARRYNQLYLNPETGISETGVYSDIVQFGKTPREVSKRMENGLSGFKCSKNDKFFSEITPVGKIEILYIQERSDFERFLQIMAYRGEPVSISEDLDSAEIDGIINWRKIEKHMRDFFINGEQKISWRDELNNFKKNKSNYQDDIIVVTESDYGGLCADQTGYTDFLWKEISMKMNIYGSCTRTIRRRLYPGNNNRMWEEINADCIGMLFAINKFDPELEKRILGISKNGYNKKGKLSVCYPEHRDSLDDIALKIIPAVNKVCSFVKKLIESGYTDYYEILIKLEEKKDNFVTLFRI